MPPRASSGSKAKKPSKGGGRPAQVATKAKAKAKKSVGPGTGSRAKDLSKAGKRPVQVPTRAKTKKSVGSSGAVKNNSTFPTPIIGLITPIGINKKVIAEALGEILGSLNVEISVIKLTDIISDIPRYSEIKKIVNTQDEKRIKSLMDAGDHLRKVANPAALAILGVKKIGENQLIEAGDSKRIVYIIDSIKHPAELIFLKNLYSQHFLPIAFFADRENRVSNLMKKIAGAHYIENDKVFKAMSEKLIDRDEYGGVDNGQNLRDVFPMADVFINMDNAFKLALERAIKLWFANPFITPSPEEVGMFVASAVALRSSDLSRQVGAAILAEDGSILTTGCNEAPSSKGGVIWDGDPIDIRDFNDGYDTNHRFKQSSIGEVIESLKKHNWLAENLLKDSLENLIAKSKMDKVFKGTRIDNLIEFGKIIHAEMAAITEAAKNGISINNAVLICTTFPCHMCARHIISSGIKKVIYIEPYPKSMTWQLYSKVMSTVPAKDKVLFTSFEGIGPNRYREFFENSSRKNKETGLVIDWKPRKAQPRGKMLYNLNQVAIMVASKLVDTEKEKFGYISVGGKDRTPWKMEAENED